MADKIQDFLDKYGKHLQEKNIALYAILKAFNLYRKEKFVECDNFVEMIRKGEQGMGDIEFMLHIKNKSQAPLLENIEVDFEQVSAVKRPPIGLKLKKLHSEQRFQEICEAIARYYNANIKIPVEWIKEYNELIILLSKY